jgi:hypothetical protein
LCGQEKVPKEKAALRWRKRVFGFWFFVEHWQKGHPIPSANAATSLSPPIYILKTKTQTRAIKGD